jgi:outer membrane protein OmpU
MKKVLFGTTALVAAGLIAGQASAADPIKLSVGGYMEQWVGFAVNDGDQLRRDFDEQSDSEVYFRGSTKLDNGISVAVRMDFEADRGNTGMDDSFLTLSSDSLGRIELGSTWSPDAKLAHGAPDVGISYFGTGGDVDNWVVRPAGNTSTDTARGTTDSNKVAYYSPTFSGFQVGASYAADEVAGGNPAALASSGPGNATAYALAAAYNGTIGELKVGADVSWYDSSTSRVGLGGSIGFGAFTIGGNYTRIIAGITNAATTSTNGHAFNLGASFATGPYAFSLGWGRTKLEGSTADASEDVQDIYILSGSYSLGAGVALQGSAFYANYDDEAGVTSNENSGYGIVGGFRVDF